MQALCGAQALQVMNIPADARTAGLAGAGAALDADAFVSARNVSAAALSDGTAAVGLDYNLWAPGGASLGIAGAGGFMRFGRTAVALDARFFGAKPYDIISGVSKVIGTYKPRDIMAGIGVAYRIADPLSVGVTARFVSSDIAEKAKGTAFCADVNLSYSAGAFNAAAGVANLGSKISYGGPSYALPAMAKAGEAYSAAGLTASFEADYLFSGALMAGLGVEYCIADIVSVRAGYHYGDPAGAIPSYASLGLGAAFSGFSLDLAFITASDIIGNTLVFGAAYSF